MTVEAKGKEWLYNYLWEKGLRDNKLRIAWVLGMREGEGDPNSVTNSSMSWNWSSDAEPHYDVGLYQINNTHLSAVQSRYNGNMTKMFNVENNYDMFLHLSQNVTYLYDWALEPNGKTFNWDEKYGGRNNYEWAADTEVNHAVLWADFKKWDRNKFGTSQNGWPVVKAGDPRLVTLTVPGVPSKFKVTARKEVAPLLASFVSDYHKLVLDISGSPDDYSYCWMVPAHIIGKGQVMSLGSGTNNLQSATAVALNTVGSGSTVPTGHPYYNYWSSHASILARLNNLLDSYDVIHWNGPTAWGGKITANYPNDAFNFGLFYIKPTATLASVANKINVLGITPAGRRKNPLPNGPS